MVVEKENATIQNSGSSEKQNQTEPITNGVVKQCPNMISSKCAAEENGSILKLSGNEEQYSFISSNKSADERTRTIPTINGSEEHNISLQISNSVQDVNHVIQSKNGAYKQLGTARCKNTIEEHSQIPANRNYSTKQYPTDLNMFFEIPTEIVGIEDFEELAYERVRLLTIFDMVNIKNANGVTYRKQVLDEANKLNLKYFLPLLKGTGNLESRQLDHLSHFILRLFYCRSDESRQWFMNRELDFFNLKLENAELAGDITLFMKSINMNCALVTDDEMQEGFFSDIISSTSQNSSERTRMYKIPFEQVLDLVTGRKVLLRHGSAYIPHEELAFFLNSLFHTNLSNALSICEGELPVFQHDERFENIWDSLNKNSTQNDDYSMSDKNNVSISQLDGLSIKSFPLCMKEMHETFKKTHHLRHAARLQYGLYLKGIGVNLKDSLKFWKDGFTQKDDIDSEIFEKRYAYFIRHSYGQEGKRANYTPHSCIKIIFSSVLPGDNHGCPFKHTDQNTLREKLLNNTLREEDADAIIQYASQGHYQLACTKYFEVMHGTFNSNGINHPNQYFEESQRLINGKSEIQSFL